MLQHLFQVLLSQTIPSRRTEKGDALLEVPRCPVDSMASRGPYSIRQAKEKAWPSFSCKPRNLPDEFIRVGSKGEKQIV